MKTIKIFILLLVGLVTINGNSQTPALNKQKYDTYRENLKYFVVVGEGPQKSIIAERRETGGRLSFGDGGLNQGWYIGVLATEYALLLSEGNSLGVTNTLNELYCALLAVERLDVVAESKFFGTPSPDYIPGTLINNLGPNLNGFSVRTDGWSDMVSPSFYTSINNGVSSQIDWQGNPWFPVTSMERSFSDAPHKHDFFSQDQLYHLLMGLKLTHFHLSGVTQTVTCGTTTETIDVGQMAADIAIRYINRVLDNGVSLPDILGGPVYGATSLEMMFYEEPLGLIGLGMGSARPLNPSGISLFDIGSFGAVQTNPAHMHLIVAAVSGASFATAISNDLAIYTLSEIPKYNWEAFYPLLNNHLRNDNPMGHEYYCLVEQELNDAPNTNPQNIPNVGGPFGWRTHHKYLKEATDQNNGSIFSGIFSGIDYMLLYNLYQLRQVNTIQYSQIVLSGMFAFEAGEILESTSIVLNGGSLSQVATKKIVLKNGFIAATGSNYTGVIYDPCTGASSRLGGFKGDELESKDIDFEEAGLPFSKVNIYPNPNNGQFNVEIGKDQETLIEVYDIMGKQVFIKSNMNNVLTIDISNQPKGIYLVKITIGNDVFNEKIIYQ